MVALNFTCATMARMSRIVPDMDLRDMERKRYPYDTWADGATHELVEGVDYTCKTRSMVANIKREATRRNKHGMAKRSPTGLYVQFARRFSEL